MKIRTNRQLVGLLAILIVASLVSGVLLMEQIQPAVPVASRLVSNCSTTSPTPRNVTLGSSGSMTFSCSTTNPTGNPAFTTTSTVIATPTFTGLAAPYNATSVYIYDANGSPTTGFCSGRQPGQKIESGVEETIPANGWNYCVDYIDVGPDGLPEFKISWST